MSVSTMLTMPSTTSFLAARNTAGCRKYNASALSMIKRKNSKKHTTRYKYATALGKEYVNKRKFAFNVFNVRVML